jgi:hypothetical protein
MAIENLKTRLAILEKETEEASKGREETTERTEKLEKLAKLKEENAKLKAELQQYAENDPELIEAYSTFFFISLSLSLSLFLSSLPTFHRSVLNCISLTNLYAIRIRR